MRYLLQITRAAIAALVLAFSLSASAADVSAQTVYDAVNDFSITSPTGVWSYGFKPSNGPGFIPYNQPHVDAYTQSGGLGIDVWNFDPNDNDPNTDPGLQPALVGRNRSGQQQNYLGIQHPADVLILHPGPNDEKSVVRWQAPAAGLYQVKGRFQVIHNGGTDVSVLYNTTDSTTALFTSVMGAFGDQKEFTLFVYVETGDTIDFAVGYGSNNDYYSDSTGLSATIRPFGISGRVTNECGVGLGGVKVRLQTNLQLPVTTTTDANGRYSFNLTRVGRTYTVTALLTEKELRYFRYEPESYTFAGMSEPQTANFVKHMLECPSGTLCLDEPPCYVPER